MYKLSEIKYLCERAGKAACVRAWAGDEKWARIFAKEAVTWYWILADVAGPDVMASVSGYHVNKLVDMVEKVKERRSKSDFEERNDGPSDD